MGKILLCFSVIAAVVIWCFWNQFLHEAQANLELTAPVSASQTLGLHVAYG